MPVTLAIGDSEDDRAELSSLADWLDREAELAGTSITWTGPPIAPGQMGPVSDSLVVALGSGSAGAILARSISVWLNTRTSDVTLKISNGKRTVQLTARRLRDPSAMIREMQQFMSDGEADGDASA